MIPLNCFLGMKFQWKYKPNFLECHVHQEAFSLDLIEQHGLSDCNKSPRSTPFHCGLPIDMIQPSTLPVKKQAPLTKRYQELVGSLNWISISTHPDITATVSLLSEHQACPSEQHMDAAWHVVSYLASTTAYSISLWSQGSRQLESFVNYPIDQGISALCDANWGPMDASVPKKNADPIEYSLESLRSISGWTILDNGSPITWGACRHKNTTQSSCQAEVHSINETTKLLLSLKLFYRDIGLPITTAIPIRFDNQGAVYWSKGTTTKKMK